MSSSMSTRKLLKLKQVLDSLELERQQLRVKIEQFKVDLQAFGLDLKMKKEVEQPVVSIEETHTQERNEVNFDLPPKFDKYEEHEKETIEEEEKEEEMEGTMVEEPKEEPHEEYFPPKEETTLLPIHLPRLQIFQPTTPFYSFTIKEPNPFCDFGKPSFKVSYNKLRAFKEWKFIIQAEWEAQLIKDELFEWLILVFGLSKAQGLRI